jgi:coproporphyrinogen III oxidase-like Fe-S oxidoreductase
LRVVDGVPEAELPEGARDRLHVAEEEGWLERRGGRLHPTPSGWLVLDDLVPGLTT